MEKFAQTGDFCPNEETTARFKTVRSSRTLKSQARQATELNATNARHAVAHLQRRMEPSSTVSAHQSTKFWRRWH
jgi:hypothetical protein